MGLLVWLPLNGDVENKGASLTTIINNSAVVDNAGKIGKCYSFNGNNYYISLAGQQLFNCFKGGSTPFSICMWVYHGDSRRAILFGDWSTANSIGFNIELSTAHAVRFYWNSNPDYWPGEMIVGVNTWSHITITYDGSTITSYLNGVKKATRSGTLAALNKTAGEFRLGRDNRTTDTALNGKLNDVRIYDHCLSAAEVHEISQGLVLHYKLDTPANINNNLYVGSEKFTGTWGNSSNWTTATETYQNFVVKQRSATWGGLSQNISCAQNDIFTISFYGKVDSGGNIQSIHRSNLGNVTTGLAILGGNFSTGYYWVQNSEDGTQWKRYWATVKIIGSDVTYLQWRLENSVSGKNFYICGIKLEKGEVATAWSPAASEAGETNIIQDSSGYGHNGTILNTITLSSDTPRYSASTNLTAGNSMINCGRGGMVTDSITVNFWLKSSSWANPVSCTEGGGWNFEASDTCFRFPVYIASVGYKYGKSTTTKAQICNNEWHMLTGIYDRINQKIQIYVDGKLDNDYATGTSNNIGYHGSNCIWIGAEATGSNTTASNGMVGLFGDFRIYCTALSAADVKQLYEVGAKVDNKGNLHTYEINEHGQNKLKKTGVFYNYATEPYIQLADGSCWKLMLFHYVDNGNNLFTSSNASYNDGFGLYSRLRDIDNFNYNNKYEFYVIQDGVECRWTQTNAPMTTTSVAGFTAVSGTPGGGICKCSGNTLLAATNSTGNWWRACGCWTKYNGGIPGFGSSVVCKQYLALYARIDKITYKTATGVNYANNLIEF